MAQQQQDVVYTRDSQNNVIIDRYAMALEIAEGENPAVWQYDEVILPWERAIVHYAKLLSAPIVSVKGSQAMGALTPEVNYNVYVDLKLEDCAAGFDDNVIFIFSDGNTVRETSVKLQKGDNRILVGQFVPPCIGLFPIVNVSMNTGLSTRPRKGLVVRRMSFTTA